MGACGSGYGTLAPEFAEKVELELVHAELRERLLVPPSREVLREEHRRDCFRCGRRVALRETAGRIIARAR